MNCTANKTELQDIIAAVRGQFDDLLSSVSHPSSGEPLHEVERGIFQQLLRLGCSLLQIFLGALGTGNVGNDYTDKGGVIRKRKGARSLMYWSIFGQIRINRTRYWEREVGSVFPLDGMLNLPRNCYSYLLQEWGMLIGVQGAWGKVTVFLKKMLDIDLWGSSCERIATETAKDVEQFYTEKEAPEATEEGELMVVTLDGKGVPIKKQEPTEKRIRLKRGEKPGKKKMTTVTAAYTIDRYMRKVDDIVKDIDDKSPAHEETRKADRPIPKHKIAKASFEGKETAVRDLADQVKKRDPERQKEGVALMDGEPKLRTLVAEFLPSFCIILDLYHVLEYLWKAVYVLHSEGTDAATRWVQRMLKLLLEGKVEEIILYLRGLLTYSELSKAKCKVLEKVIGYLDRGKDYMRYDYYLSKGYPIGSGVVEGVCRNLVKDRMELVGMRWTIPGAESMLKLRSLSVNGISKDFWDFRTGMEKQRLYGHLPEAGKPSPQEAA